MEQGVLREEIRLSLQPSALLSEGIGEVLEGVEAAIGHGPIGQSPESFSRLQLWGIRREGEGLNTGWMSLHRRDMKTPSVLNDQDVVVLSRPDTLGEGRHDELVSLLIQDREQPEPAFTALWIDKSVDVEPFIARVNGAYQGLSGGCPDGPEDGL